MLEEFSVIETMPVRWRDMDAMGHVNNATYFTYFESSRITYFKTVNLYDAGEPEHGPALAHVECDFRQQVHHPDTLLIGARVKRIGTKSLHFEHRVVRQGDGSVVAEGRGVIAWIDYKVGKSIPIPDDLRSRIESFEGRPLSGE